MAMDEQKNSNESSSNIRKRADLLFMHNGREINIDQLGALL